MNNATIVGSGPKPSAGTASASTAAGGKVWPIVANAPAIGRKSRPAGRVTKIARPTPIRVEARLAAATIPACDSHSDTKLARPNTGGLTSGNAQWKSGANSGMPAKSATNRKVTQGSGEVR